ncbi:uncharacterized protein TRAVEDRAFT_48769 [Trametes versicolor FP-101664 SS1]|uniref:uncharacterized protein n=1 Tax=Trametes versicolor (strain FP-101664) TaxID=717944 RepID=UPI000462456F|nr:uncharacterized protein TRAVEDRAFT_48769 [Trametes versicolor FP-101664 SS1]EIW57735.1 hypothetical protein TRAVEDRAFT_48769 [Trametes versicolor FP-101664 SS1]
MSKEPTRQQLSSKLAYQANTPAFLVRLQKQFGGGGGRHDEDEDDEFEYDGSGRPPIPRRPAIPERPDDEAGSADEEEDEERPQVIVLREGKHLTEREVENEKRKAKGLQPLPEPSAAGSKPEGDVSKEGATPASSKQPSASQGLSFSSGAGVKGKSSKRKAVGDGRDDAAKPQGSTKPTKKKAKKQDKKLLSFEDDA